MGLQSSWQSDAREGRRYRQIVRDQKQKRGATLRLVAPIAPPPDVAPAEFFRDHEVAVPRRKPIEFVLFGIAAIGVHVGAAWLLANLPAGGFIEKPKSQPVEMVLAPPPEVEPPPPPPPPKEPPKIVKTEKVKVQRVRSCLYLCIRVPAIYSRASLYLRMSSI